MKTEIKNYLHYAKNLSYESLLQEGQMCAIKLYGSVMDLKTGEIKSQELLENKLSTATIALCQASLNDSSVTSKELDFISKTSNIPIDFLSEIIDDISPKNFSESYENVQEVGHKIIATFKTKDEILNLAKYVILVSVVDNKVTFSEKKFVAFFDKLYAHYNQNG